MPSIRWYLALSLLLAAVLCTGCPPKKNNPLRLILVNGTNKTITNIEIEIPETHEFPVLTSEAIAPGRFASFELAHDTFVLGSQLYLQLGFTGLRTSTYYIYRSQPLDNSDTQLSLVLLPGATDTDYDNRLYEGQERQAEFVKASLPQP